MAILLQAIVCRRSADEISDHQTVMAAPWLVSAIKSVCPSKRGARAASPVSIRRKWQGCLCLVHEEPGPNPIMRFFPWFAQIAMPITFKYLSDTGIGFGLAISEL
jgi:hypothetical protein